MVRFLKILLLLPFFASAQTQIYRSVQAGKTSALATGTSNAMTISSGTATFNSAIPDTIGVGDAIQYDDDGDGDIDANDSICFIHGRTSSTVYTVKNAAGSNPADVVGDQDWSIFRAYTSWQLAENGTENTGIDADLINFDTHTTGRDISAATGTNEVWRFAMYRGEESVSASTDLDGWVTGANNFLIFYSPILPSEVGVSQRHSGSLSASSCYLLTRTNAGGVLRINTGGTSTHPGHVWIDGLQLRSTGSAALSYHVIDMAAVAMISGDTIKISNNIVKGASTGDGSAQDQFGIGWDGVNIQNAKVWNNIVYDFRTTQTRGWGIGNGFSASGTMWAYNNTVHNCKYNYLRTGGTITVKNCISQSDITDGFSGTFDAASDYNISDRAADAPGANSKSGTSVVFTNEAGDIFLLNVTDTGAKASGISLAADADIPFNTDILNSTRGAVWDMGAHQVTTSTGRRKWLIK